MFAYGDSDDEADVEEIILGRGGANEQNQALLAERVRAVRALRLQFNRANAEENLNDFGIRVPHSIYTVENHLCDFCFIRTNCAQSHPEIMFMPYSLQQTIIIRLVYDTFFRRLRETNPDPEMDPDMAQARADDQVMRFERMMMMRGRRGNRHDWLADVNQDRRAIQAFLRMNNDAPIVGANNRHRDAHLDMVDFVPIEDMGAAGHAQARAPGQMFFIDQAGAGAGAGMLRVQRQAQAAGANQNVAVLPRAPAGAAPAMRLAIRMPARIAQQRAPLPPFNLGNFYPTLPRDILAMIRQGVQELARWYTSMCNTWRMRSEQYRWMWHDCFLRQVHWMPDNKAMLIDHRATANMMLETMRHTEQLPTVRASMLTQFNLACNQMLEEHIQRLWHLFQSTEGGRQMVREQPDFRSQQTLMGFWVALLSNDAQALLATMRNILTRRAASRPEKFESGLSRIQELWPVFKTHMNLEEQIKLRDHLFHTAVTAGNLAVVRFIWRQEQAIIDPDGRSAGRAMLDASHCCGSLNNNFYTFFNCIPERNEGDHAGDSSNYETYVVYPEIGREVEKVGRRHHVALTPVEERASQMFNELWQLLTDEERQMLLLMANSSLFVSSASRGLHRVAYLMWSAAGPNQRFVLLFQSGAGAFREACAAGYLDTVYMIWSSLDANQRHQLMTVGNNSAFVSACANDRVDVVTHLWHNMTEATQKYLISSCMKRCFELCMSGNHVQMYRMLKTLLPVDQYLMLVFSKNHLLFSKIAKKSLECESVESTVPTAKKEFFIGETEYVKSKKEDYLASVAAENETLQSYANSNSNGNYCKESEMSNVSKTSDMGDQEEEDDEIDDQMIYEDHQFDVFLQ